MLHNNNSPLVGAMGANNSAQNNQQNTKPTFSIEQHILPQVALIDEQIDAACIAWPQLPNDALYGIAGEIVNLAINDSEVDPASILLTTLTWFATAVGTNPYINIGDTKHPARLFTVLVGSTSRARKGTSEKPVRRIFERAEKLETLPPLNITPGPLSTGEGLIYAVRDADEDSSNDKINVGITDKRILCVEAEFGSVLRMGKRDGNTLSTILRQAWDSGDIQPLTKCNRIKVTGAHINIIGHITYHELNTLLSSTDTWNGFANRFLWACVRRSKYVALPNPMPDREVEIISRKLGEIIKIARNKLCITFTPQAKELWVKEYYLLTADVLGSLGAATSRAESQTMRLALVYALMDGVSEIDVNHLKAAISLWQFCFASSMFLFGNATTDANTNKILQALSENEKTTTQLNALFSGHLNSHKLNEALSTLQLLGKITSETSGGGQKKGKATKTWRLK